MMSAQRPPVEDLRTLLQRDHQRIVQQFEQLLSAFRACAQEESAQLWTEFDNGLQAHLELEEHRIIPEFAKVDPAEAAALLREHDEIRTLVQELGVGVDLHVTRVNAIAKLGEALARHAQREDALLYRTIENLREEDQHTIREKILEALQGFIDKARRPSA